MNANMNANANASGYNTTFGNPGMPAPSGARIGDVASGAYSFALGAVDRFAGAETRRRVEGQVGNLTACTYVV